MAQHVAVHFASAWLGFRIAELQAVADALDIPLSIDKDDLREFYARPTSVLLKISLTDEATIRRLASRVVLAKSFVDVWASGETWEELAEHCVHTHEILLRPTSPRARPSRWSSTHLASIIQAMTAWQSSISWSLCCRGAARST